LIARVDGERRARERSAGAAGAVTATGAGRSLGAFGWLGFRVAFASASATTI
jgi:hypothetical protein